MGLQLDVPLQAHPCGHEVPLRRLLLGPRSGRRSWPPPHMLESHALCLKGSLVSVVSAVFRTTTGTADHVSHQLFFVLVEETSAHFHVCGPQQSEEELSPGCLLYQVPLEPVLRSPDTVRHRSTETRHMWMDPAGGSLDCHRQLPASWS